MSVKSDYTKLEDVKESSTKASSTASPLITSPPVKCLTDGRCSYCWLKNCKHWNVQVETINIVNKGILTDTATKEYKVRVACLKCLQPVSNYQSKGFLDAQCSGCSRFITYDPDRAMPKHNGRWPRAFCKVCKATGVLPLQKFEQCSNCQGTGGFKCIYCTNGVRLDPIRIDIDNIKYDLVTATQCTCKNGFVNRCIRCWGTGAIGKGATVDTECTECFSSD